MGKVCKIININKYISYRKMMEGIIRYDKYNDVDLGIVFPETLQKDDDILYNGYNSHFG
jgi:hypothetical protein